MFRIITTFTRENTTKKFFHEEFKDHLTVIDIHNRFATSDGFLGKEILLNENLIVEIAMNFKIKDDFWEFAKINHDIIEQRTSLIEQWCKSANHKYSWRMEEVDK
jgi:hypothetical protein